MKKRYLIGILLLFLASSAVFAQEQLSLRDRGNLHFERYEYARAAAVFTTLASDDHARYTDLVRAGESYYFMRDFAQSAQWYARVVAHEDATAADILRYADVLKASGKYAEAKSQYQRYSSLPESGLEDVSIRIAGTDSALNWMSKPTAHLLQNETGVNTAGSEFSVSLIGQDLYYTGEPANHGDDYGWTGRPFLKLHRANSTNDRLGNATLAGKDLNGPDFHVGPVASPDGGETLYVTRTYVGKEMGKEREGIRSYRTHRIEIYVYTQQEGEWVATSFEHNDPSGFSVGHASFSPDGNTMYFVSDRPGGQGGADIWFSERQGNSWSTPQNAGPSINTAGDELFPQVDAEGVLYYSTDGLAGMGGLDIFRSEGQKSSWSKSINLGSPLNSPGDDFAYSVIDDNELHTQGFISSNRTGGKGEDDIYSFLLEKPQPIVVVIAGKVTHKGTGNLLPGAKVELKDANGQLISSVESDSRGAFVFPADTGRNYLLHASFGRMIPDSAASSTKNIIKSDTLWVDLVLEPELEVGKVFVLEDLYYDFDKHNIRPDAALVLDALVETMNEYPTLKIELSSHTDSRGSDAYNMALSDRRARAAVDYIISRGISRDRLVAKGYGETQLVNECSNGVDCTPEQHQANRRTEVRVLEIQH